MKKKLAVILVLTTFVASILSACDGGSGLPSSKVELSSENVNVWTVAATEKVMQDQTKKYEDLHSSSDITLTVARGEYESGQIIITPGVDVASYDVKVGTLKLIDGEEVFPAENVSIYMEKYTHIARNYENSEPTGWYPDALVPFTSAKEYDENKISANTNQGLYVTYEIPSDQRSGIYTGVIELDFGAFSKFVNVSLNVLNLNVSETVHTKSIFLTQWSFHSGDLNSTQEMYDAYAKALIEYRLSPQYVLFNNNHSSEDIALYTEKAYEYMLDERCSNICIPYKTTTIETQTCFDPNIFESYVRAFVEKSFETGFNMLAKSTVYLNIIDEPLLQNIPLRTKVVCELFKKTVEEIALEIESDDSITSSIKDNVVESLRDLRNIVTAKYYDTPQVDSTGKIIGSYDEWIDTWCPTVDDYDLESNRANYDTQEEKWWYTCVSPRAPYPTYHIEDTLLSARTMSWMQAEYDVVGNLYWAVNQYAQYGDDSYEYIEDYFGTAEHYPKVNGDGYLFYPGGQYGLDKPIASMRLEAIRDGLEEYELIYALKEKYASLGFDIQNVLSSLTETLYKGTKVATNGEKFASARANLLALCEAANSSAQMCIANYVDERNGSVSYQVYLAQGYELKNNRVTVNNVETYKDGNLFTVRVKLDQKKNDVSLSVDADGKTFVYNRYIGGEVGFVSAQETQNSFIGEGVSVNSSYNEHGVHLNVDGTDGSVSQTIRFTNLASLGITKNIQKFVFKLNNPTNEICKLTMIAKYKNSKLYSEIASYELTPGENVIDVAMPVNWSVVGDIEFFIFQFGESKTAQSATSLIFHEMLVYNE